MEKISEVEDHYLIYEKYVHKNIDSYKKFVPEDFDPVAYKTLNPTVSYLDGDALYRHYILKGKGEIKKYKFDNAKVL